MPGSEAGLVMINTTLAPCAGAISGVWLSPSLGLSGVRVRVSYRVRVRVTQFACAATLMYTHT